MKKKYRSHETMKLHVLKWTQYSLLNLIKKYYEDLKQKLTQEQTNNTNDYSRSFIFDWAS